MTACEAPVDRGELTQLRLLTVFTAAPAAFWRHDVDVSLAAAKKMAGFAQLAGVQSTFFLMPRADTYNLFTREGHQTISTILACGHKVGLHCDYRNGSIEDTVERDYLLLDAGYPGTFSRHVSFHMPPACVLWRDFPGFENAYSSGWEGRYLSDSRREWTLEKEARLADDMQISLHPEHWFPCA